MYYVIEAVRWETPGSVSHVRWHRVTAAGLELQHDAPQVVPVVNAAEVCKSAEVRVYVDGGAGQFFKMKACADGIDAEDNEGVPLAARMGHLPTFELEPQA